jgi:NADPH-dependent 2,4-dienoyl-CoA reductase/sulfur reductase-like enzyme
MSSSDNPKLNADFSTQCVIVGAGPAGGALASFLASNGESRNCITDWIS